MKVNIRKSLYAVVLSCALMVVSLPAARSHEMFLKPVEFMVAPNSSQKIQLVNGTFSRSENSIERERMADVSIVTPDGVQTPLGTAWQDDEVSSWLRYSTEAPGTYVVGVSTRPSVIELSREDFIEYLKHDGILDTLTSFEETSTLTTVRERYSKHVRAIIQVGEETSDGFNAQLDYPVEILMEQNPYELSIGDELLFRVTFEGEPVANQIVRAVRATSQEDGSPHAHEHTENHSHMLRTDENGRAAFRLSEKGTWYIALIHMREVNQEDVDYESNWATATFFVE